jgi:hypothetical protein
MASERAAYKGGPIMSDDTADQAIDRHKAYMKLELLRRCITVTSVATSTYQAQQMELFPDILGPEGMVDGLMRDLVKAVSKARGVHEELPSLRHLGPCALTLEERCIVNGYSDLARMLVHERES